MHLKKRLPTLLLCVATLAGHAYAFDLSPDLVFPEHHSLYTQLPHLKPVDTKSKILKQYFNWEGTRYLFGGHSHRGIDCSALIQEIFRDAVDTPLPRTTGEQILKGHHVAKGNLKPGDLVFFQTSPGTRHVGVYVGNHEFIHASKIKGVTISSLENRYWNSHYETSRRILATS